MNPDSTPPLSDIKSSPRRPAINVDLIDYVKLAYPNCEAQLGLNALSLARYLAESFNYSVIVNHLQELTAEIDFPVESGD